MNSYELSRLQLDLRDLARRVAREYLAPLADKVEKSGELFPRTALAELHKYDLLGLDIPTEYGGQGLDALTCAIVSEEIAGGWFGAASYLMALATGPLLFAGSAEQRTKYLPGIASGEMVSAFALTEPDGGSDASSLSTTATRVGDSYRINGSKVFITNAAVADVLVAFVRTDLEAPRGKGVSMFLVDRGTPGLRIGRRLDALAHSANAIWEVFFDDCVVPAQQLLGDEGDGFRYLQVGFAKTRAVYGAKCAGVAQAALDYVAAYAEQRSQFGQPIGAFQGIRFRMADMGTNIQASRQLSYWAAAEAEEESPNAPVAAAMAKHFASATAMAVTTEAIQVMGGHGYLREHPLERYFREARLFQIGDGTSEMLRILISRHIRRQGALGRTTALTDR